MITHSLVCDNQIEGLTPDVGDDWGEGTAGLAGMPGRMKR